MRSVPRAAVLQGVVGIGRSSLSMVMPALSAMGVQCCPIPTAVLSAHTAYENPYRLSLTDAARQIAARYLADAVSFDAVYTGYLGDEEQLAVALEFLRAQRGLRLVDPVLGDDGRLYASMAPGMVAGMRELAACADILVPNLTEAALLLGEEPREEVSAAVERDWLRRLRGLGAKSVFITSCRRVGEEAMAVAVLHEGRYGRAVVPRLKASFHGTGELFASILLGAALGGRDLPGAACVAAGFVTEAMRDTIRAGTPPLEGVLIERNLQKLWGGEDFIAAWEEDGHETHDDV